MKVINVVSSYFGPATKLGYVIGAVVGLIGSAKVDGKFNSGDLDMQIMAWNLHLSYCHRFGW